MRFETQIRVMKNTARIGKPWLIARGYYEIGALQFAKHGRDGRKVWQTELVIADFNTKEAAENSLGDYLRGEGP